MYGECAVIDQMCPKWFVKFHAGDFSMGDVHGPVGRPDEVDSDKIESLIENNHCYTTRKIANIPKIFKSIELL